MSDGFSLIVYPVSDAERAKQLYGTLLGVEPYADETYYVGFRVGDQEIGLDPYAQAQGRTGVIAYRTVDDIRATLASLLDAGFEAHQDIRDVGGGKLIALVRDPDGNLLGLAQEP